TYNAKLTGAIMALRAIKDLPGFFLSNKIEILLDNYSAAKRMARNAPGAAGKLGRPVKIRWVPGYMGIPGNKRADRLAKEGATIEPPANTPPFLSWEKTRAAQALKKAIVDWWEQEAPEFYRTLEIKHPAGPPKEL